MGHALADDDEKITGRKTPADNDADWLHIWSGVEKAHKSWPITGPLAAIATNWKAWGVGIVILGFFRREGVMDAIDALLGVVK